MSLSFVFFTIYSIVAIVCNSSLSNPSPFASTPVCEEVVIPLWHHAHSIWHQTAEKVVLDYIPRYAERTRHKVGVLINLSGTSSKFVRNKKNSPVPSEPIHPLDHNVPRTVLTENSMDGEYHRNDFTESNASNEQPQSSVVVTDSTTKEVETGVAEVEEAVKQPLKVSAQQDLVTALNESIGRPNKVIRSAIAITDHVPIDTKPVPIETSETTELESSSVRPNTASRSAIVTANPEDIDRKAVPLETSEAVDRDRSNSITESVSITSATTEKKSVPTSVASNASELNTSSPEVVSVETLSVASLTTDPVETAVSQSAGNKSSAEEHHPSINNTLDSLISNTTFHGVDDLSFNATDFNSDVDANIPMPEKGQVEPVLSDSTPDEKEEGSHESLVYDVAPDESDEPFIDNGVEFLDEGTDY
jgi:hypothetical protein